MKMRLWQRVLDGTSAESVALTNLATEVELGPGVWAVFGTVNFQCQLNNESGAGFGANPVTWPGEEVSSPFLYHDVQQLVVSIGVGGTGYLMLKKLAGEADGNAQINYVRGP